MADPSVYPSSSDAGRMPGGGETPNMDVDDDPEEDVMDVDDDPEEDVMYYRLAGSEAAADGNANANDANANDSPSKPSNNVPLAPPSSPPRTAAVAAGMGRLHPHMRSAFRMYGGAGRGGTGGGHGRRGVAASPGVESSSSPRSGSSPPPITELRRLIRARRWGEAVERLGLCPNEGMADDLIQRVTVLHDAIELDAPPSVVRAIVDVHPTLSHVRRLKDGRTAVHLAVCKLQRDRKCSPRKVRDGDGDEGGGNPAVAVRGAKTTGLDDFNDDEGCEGGGPTTAAVRIMLSRSPRAVLISDKCGQTPLHQWATSSCRQDDRGHYLQHVEMLRDLLSASERNRSLAVVGDDDDGGGSGTAGTPETAAIVGPDGRGFSFPSMTTFATTGTGTDGPKRPHRRPLHCLFSAGTFEFSSHSSFASNNARLSPLLTLEVVRLLLEADPTCASARTHRHDTPLHCLLRINHRTLAETTSTIPAWALATTCPTSSTFGGVGAAAVADDNCCVGANDNSGDDNVNDHLKGEEEVETCHPSELIPKIVRELLSNCPGAATMQNRYMRTPLHVACEHDAPEEIVAQLLEAPGGRGTWTRNAAFIFDHDRRLPLHVACRCRARPGVVGMVLEAYPDAASEKDCFGETPFSYLTKNILDDILDGKAVTLDLIQFLAKAAKAAKTAKAEIFTAKCGADEGTFLHRAVLRGASGKVVQVIHEAYPGAASVTDNKGNTPLHLACASGASMMCVIKTMLTLLPDGPSIRNASGKTPLYLASACSSASPRLIGALLDADESAASVPSDDGTPPLLAAVESMAPATAIRELFCNYPDGVMRRNSLGSSTIGAMVQNFTHLRKSSAIEGGMAAAASLSVMREILELYPAASTILDAAGRSPVCHAFLQFKGTLSIDFSKVEKMAPEVLRSMCRGDAWEQLSILLRASFDCQATVEDDDSPLLVVHAICNSDCPLEAMKFAISSRPDEVRVRCPGQGRLPLHILAAKPIRRVESQEDTPGQGEGGGEGDGQEGGGNPPSQSNEEEAATDAATEVRVAAAELHNKCTHLAIETVLDHYPQGARVPDNEGRVALNLCIESGRGWQDGLKRIMEAAPGALQARDTKTHLYPFMLAASCEETTLTDVYELLLSSPETVRHGIV